MIPTLFWFLFLTFYIRPFIYGLVMRFIGDFFGRIFGSSSYRKKLLNPVLNDPKDVTPKVIEKILNNSLESITINYNMKLINEFKFDDEEFNSRTLHFFSPFSIA